MEPLPVHDKHSLRQALRHARVQLSSENRHARNNQLIARINKLLAELNITRVAAFSPTPLEPAAGLVHALLDQQSIEHLWLPRCLPEHQLGWAEVKSLDDLAPGAYGILEPTAAETVPLGQLSDDIDAILIPALAIDFDGYRLGQGGGFYDRALENITTNPTKLLRIGIVYDHEHIRTVPHHHYDSVVHRIVTDRRSVDLT